MKRITIFSCLCMLGIATFGQIQKKSGGTMLSQRDNPPLSSLTGAKSGGDVIWSTTFDWANPSDPQGWTLPAGWEIRDLSDLGNNWTWLQDSIKGRWTNERGPAWFSSRGDGFIAVPMDYYNYRDGLPTDNASNTYITTPPINCSGRPSVVVKLNQYYRFCCENDNTGHLELQVTNDNGVHWATYDLSYGIGHNTFTPVKYRSPEFNISDVAAGMPNVRIKIFFHDVPAYFWAIDDLTLCEAYENDLKLEDSWVEVNGGYENTVGHINYLPFSQIGMTGEGSGLVGDFTFRGAFLNNGMADAENAKLTASILKNGVEIYNQNSPQSTIWPLERDTFRIGQQLSPNDYGDYKVTLAASADNGEETAGDNSSVYYFTINDSLYQRSDMSAESAISTRVWANGNKAGDLLAVRYDIKTDVEVSSITAKIQSFTSAANPSFQFLLMKYDAEADDIIEVITSDVIPMDSTKLGWITLPLTKDGESEYLTPGQYYAAWRAWADGEIPGMFLGWDQNARAEFTSHNLIYLTSISTWYQSDKLPIIGLNLNKKDGPSEADVTFNVDMNKHIANGEFKPGIDFLDISGSFNDWSGSGIMADPEGDGIYTLTINSQKPGEKIEYKYRINSNWTTSEFPNGGQNRSYFVRYWNVLNDIYNAGQTTGIYSEASAPAFSVYPNPTTGQFTITINNPAPVNTEIVISTINGQVCYRKLLVNISEAAETISTNLPGGLYFMKVTAGKSSTVQKLVIN